MQYPDRRKIAPLKSSVTLVFILLGFFHFPGSGLIKLVRAGATHPSRRKIHAHVPLFAIAKLHPHKQSIWRNGTRRRFPREDMKLGKVTLPPDVKETQRVALYVCPLYPSRFLSPISGRAPPRLSA